ncbi:MAG: hypothetical protein ACRD0P_07635 [Stackebrandtia sp.]
MTDLLTTTEVAALARKDIKTAIKDGAVHLPEGAKVSVRRDVFSQGSAVDITVKDVDVDWATYPVEPGYRAPTPRANKLRDQLEAIAAKHRKPDGRTFFIEVHIHHN